MKHIISALFVFFITACTPSSHFSAGSIGSDINLAPSNKQLEYSKDTLIIFFDNAIGDKYVLEAVKKFNAKVIYRYDMMNGMAIKINKNNSLDKYVIEFKKVKGVVSVEKDYVTKIN